MPVLNSNSIIRILAKPVTHRVRNWCDLLSILFNILFDGNNMYNKGYWK